MFKNYFLTSIRTLRQNPLYTALSVFGIALTFVFVCVLLMIMEGGKADFIPPKYAERTWFLPEIDNGQGTNHNITSKNIETWLPKMTTPELIVVITELDESIIVNNKTRGLDVMGVSDHYFDVIRLKFLRGRPMNRLEIAEGLPVTVLAKSIADLYFGRNEDPIGKIFELKGVPYRVVGIVENVSILGGNYGITYANMWVPLETVKKFNFGYAHHIFFTGKDKASITEMQEEFARVLDETNLAEGSLWRLPTSQKRTVEQNNTLIPGEKIGLLMTCFILMLIPALNILSLNVCKSYDRSEEIAIRRTFGAPKYTIFIQLFVENFMLTLVGAVLGICITQPLLNFIDQAMLNVSILMPLTMSLKFNLKTIFWVVGPCVLLFSFLSGCVPAWITTKREIVNVLKGETQ